MSQTDAPAHRYTPALANDIELRWQSYWEERGTFRQPNPGESGFDATKPKYFVLDMFPYPSGAGLHVGHPEGYTATCIVSRYKRMTGHNVLHPMGFDAFGLPAEQYAIQTGVHPAETTQTAMDNFRRQLKRFGFDYDWSREIATIDPGYYKWTQWIWLQAYNAYFDEYAIGPDGSAGAAKPIDELVRKFESGEYRIDMTGTPFPANIAQHHISAYTGPESMSRGWSELTAQEQRDVLDNQRLAYLGEQTVNWCPKLGTALANEEVIDGRSERGGYPVLRKPLRQWMFRITAYADRLLSGLEGIDWPDSTKAQQREWIGRSEGAEVDFPIESSPEIAAALEADGAPGALRVFTTRPDTIFGATYMVVAPEHDLVRAVIEHAAEGTDVQALRDYVERSKNRSDLERQENKEKTGVALGIYATNPATGEPVPVWTADYVLMGYGTGAIMAVPAHDDRDFDFALQFGLHIKDVIYPKPLYSMWYAGTQIPAGLLGNDDWKEHVAEFIAYTVSEQIGIEGFDEASELVASRRSAEQETHTSEHVQDEQHDTDERRGLVVQQWLETIEEMKFDSLGDFRERMHNPMRSQRLGTAFTDPGRNINSSNDGVSLNGLETVEAKTTIMDWLEQEGVGSRRVNYKLRDWLFSRQRYWGEPFPIVFDDAGNHHAVNESALPIELPDLADYKPAESDDPAPLLAKATDWMRTTPQAVGIDDSFSHDAQLTREANTMPGWAGSCWYYLRYMDPHNTNRFADAKAESYWMGTDRAAASNGVDLYVGGAEHATLHLLYARFWHKMLFDLGHVSTHEPVHKLFHQGLILSYGYQRSDKSLVPVDQVMVKDQPEIDLTSGETTDALDLESASFVERETGESVTRIICKMSKSLKNVVNPDDIIDEFGVDTFRLYEMYIGPLESSQPWRTQDMIGLLRFLQRTWRLVINEETGELTTAAEPNDDIERALHRTIQKVGSDIEGMSFNTAIAAMIEWVNAASKHGATNDQLNRFCRILSPFAPHITEELWHRLGYNADNQTPCSTAPWPTYEESMLSDDTIEIPVQLMGKVKARINIPSDADADTMKALALEDDAVKALIEGKTVRKVITVPGRLINIVAN